MRKLIAKQTIMVEGTPYKPGQELPQRDPHRVAAWVKNGAAVWAGEAPPDKPVKEKPPAQATGGGQATDRKPDTGKKPAAQG